MASLFTRGKTYYVQVSTNGKVTRRSLRTTSKQIAKAKLLELERDRMAGELRLPTQTPIPELVGAYMRHVLTFKTAANAGKDASVLRNVFGVCCPELEQTRRGESNARAMAGKRRDRPVRPLTASCAEAVTTAQVEEHLSGLMRERAWSPKTYNQHRTILQRMYTWAIESERIRIAGDRNPVARIRRARERAPEIRHLTLAQIDEQLAALAHDSVLLPMVAVLIYVGLRRAELLWLQREDIDLAAGFIRVRAKTVGGASWQPKTASNRLVPIQPALVAILRAHPPRPCPGEWRFPSLRGARWDPDNFSQALARAQRAAGLPWHCLDFRHTYGSLLAQRGLSLHQISKLMGNSPEVCRRHYAHLATEDLVEVAQFVANVAGRS
ncbi:MAG: tyrosine-type recombinase/integrase [Planctomycetota bacterium]